MIIFSSSSVYLVAGSVMVILIVLEKRMKQIAKRPNAKIGNLIVGKANVYSNLGDVMEKKIVPQVIFNTIYKKVIFERTPMLEVSGSNPGTYCERCCLAISTNLYECDENNQKM